MARRIIPHPRSPSGVYLDHQRCSSASEDSSFSSATHAMDVQNRPCLWTILASANEFPDAPRMSDEDRQTLISSVLRLLRLLRYRPDLGELSNRDFRNEADWRDLRCLQAIALFSLSNRLDSDVAATAFTEGPDRNLILNISKNEIQVEDPSNMSALLEILSNPSCAGLQDCIEFLFTHSGNEVRRRLKNLRNFIPRSSLKQFVPMFLQSNPEFSWNEDTHFGILSSTKFWRRTCWKSDTISAITAGLLTCLGSPGSTSESMLAAIMAAHILQGSALYRSWRNVELDSNTRDKFNDFHRQLNKVAEYVHIETFSIIAQQRTITVEWVHPHDRRINRRPLQKSPLESAEEVLYSLLHVAKVIDDPDQKAKALLAQTKKDDQSAEAKVFLHCELTLILALSKRRDPADTTQRKQHPIGCTKRSCLPCYWWMILFNDLGLASEIWLTAGSHGHAYEKWALPGSSRIDPHQLCDDRLLVVMEYFCSQAALAGVEHGLSVLPHCKEDYASTSSPSSRQRSPDDVAFSHSLTDVVSSSSATDPTESKPITTTATTPPPQPPT
ncbi:hypothetical protein H0H93_015589 [Arthromyces matolae]|nr:hypothetical protein H0H93_015589 [Arthromyces matolae]